MSSPNMRPPRVLHVLAAFDEKEAQGRCVHTIASMGEGEHFLACTEVLGDAVEPFSDVVETGGDLQRFGWTGRDRLEAAVRQVRPDVVHFHGGPLGAMTAASGWTAGRPVVASIYGWGTVNRRSVGRGVGVAHLRRTPVLASRTFGNTFVPKVAVGAALRRAGVRAVTTPDRSVAETLAHEAFPVGTFEGITPPRKSPPWRPRRGRFVFAGRAELTRGPDLLAEAVARLRSRGRDVTADLFFLGTPDAQKVAATAAREGCTVSVGGVDLDAELATATAMVLPFRFDTTTLAPSMVATEAMAAGVPVIASDVHCLRAAVTDSVTGLLVPPGDIGSLCRALERLTADPALARRLGDGGIDATADRWRHSNVVDLAQWAYLLATTGLGSHPPTLPVQPTQSIQPTDPALAGGVAHLQESA